VAVVFISPKQRQKVFFLGITIALLLFMVFVSLAVFLSKPTAPAPELIFNKPKVAIDMAVFDSEQFKNLQLLENIQTQFSYIATAKDGSTQTGFIQAESKQNAATLLTEMGLTVSELKEVEIGRDNPFTPYYQTNGAAETTKAKAKTK